jgi:acetyl-CoA C-acetyltransferase
MDEIVVIGAARTPMGRFGGSLKDVATCDLGAVAIRAAIQRAGIDPQIISEVIYGSCRQAGNGVNPSRTAALRGGVPLHASTNTLNMACPSGMKSVHLAAQALRLGDSEVVVAGGMDSMSTIPYLLKGVRWQGLKMGPKTIEDGWSDSVDPITGEGMGDTAENLVEKYGLTRQELDEFAAASHHKAHAAQQAGLFETEIVPVEVPARGRKQPGFTFSADETIRATISVEKMGKLPAVFRRGGSCTAGNACGMSDGACGLVVTTRARAAELGATPLFSLVSFAQTAAPNETMGEGPGLSIPMALEAAGMTLADMDLYEVNEAFAAQVLANERVLNWDRDKLNVHGGAIALGHPTGISGARIMLTGYHALRARGGELLVASICGGGGVTTAMVIRRES